MQPKPKQPFESLPTYMTDSKVTVVDLTKDGMIYSIGQPLTEEEYAAYAAKLDKLGFVKRNAAH